MFEEPPAIQDETDAFLMTLAEGIVTFEMKEHYPSEEAARIPVEEYLQAWEIDVALKRNRTSLRFVFQAASIIDRDPPPPPPPGAPCPVELGGAITGKGTISGELTVTKREYPTPP